MASHLEACILDAITQSFLPGFGFSQSGHQQRFPSLNTVKHSDLQGPPPNSNHSLSPLCPHLKRFKKGCSTTQNSLPLVSCGRPTFCHLVIGFCFYFFFLKKGGSPANTKTSSSEWMTCHATMTDIHLLVVYNYLFICEGFLLFLPGFLAAYIR